jgi:2-phospho-L-lactate guanylyltransferase
LDRAQSFAVGRGADAVMVVPADLPLLTGKDIAWLRKKAGRPPLVAIAPDRSGQGTNALCIAPPGRIRFSFGRNSFQRHIRAARMAGGKAKILRRRALAQDLDRPEDLSGVRDLFWDGDNPRIKPKARDD